MKKFVYAIVAVVALAAIYLMLFPVGQRPDESFGTAVANPAFASRHPRVLFDEAHYNAHTSRGGYAPFVSLMKNDGCEVERSTARFTGEVLKAADVVVIVNAAGGSNPKFGGFNLEPLRRGRRDAPAFSPDEIRAVQQWVRDGGSLLLIADHYPFGSASAALAAVFGVTMHCGFVEAEHQFPGQTDSGTIRFARADHLLGEHPILQGRSPEERINLVLSFLGQSLDSPHGTPLLLLPAGAVESVPPPPNFRPTKPGIAQAVALEYGRGRVVIFGEAAMLTAQVEKSEKFGMNVPGTDNRQLTLNVMHWLTRLL